MAYSTNTVHVIYAEKHVVLLLGWLISARHGDQVLFHTVIIIHKGQACHLYHHYHAHSEIINNAL